MGFLRSRSLKLHLCRRQKDHEICRLFCCPLRCTRHSLQTFPSKQFFGLRQIHSVHMLDVFCNASTGIEPVRRHLLKHVPAVADLASKIFENHFAIVFLALALGAEFCAACIFPAIWVSTQVFRIEHSCSKHVFLQKWRASHKAHCHFLIFETALPQTCLNISFVLDAHAFLFLQNLQHHAFQTSYIDRKRLCESRAVWPEKKGFNVFPIFFLLIFRHSVAWFWIDKREINHSNLWRAKLGHQVFQVWKQWNYSKSQSENAKRSVVKMGKEFAYIQFQIYFSVQKSSES